MVQSQQNQQSEIDKTTVLSEGIAALKEVLLAAIAAHTSSNATLMEGMSGGEKLELIQIQSKTALELMRIMSEQFQSIQAMERKE